MQTEGQLSDMRNGCVTEEHHGDNPPRTVYHPDWEKEENKAPQSDWEKEENKAPQSLATESFKRPTWGSPMLLHSDQRSTASGHLQTQRLCLGRCS